MTQTSLEYGDAEVERQHERRFAKAIGEALDHLVAETFCEEFGFQPAALSEARNSMAGVRRGKEPRQWQQRWTDTLLRHPLLPERFKLAIVDAIAARAGLRGAKPPELSVRQVAEEAIALLSSMGPVLADHADDLRVKLLSAINADRYR